MGQDMKGPQGVLVHDTTRSGVRLHAAPHVNLGAPWMYPLADAAARERDPDAARLVSARALRGFADGFVSVYLAAYLQLLGFSRLPGRRDRHRDAARLGRADARRRPRRAPALAAPRAARRDAADAGDRASASPWSATSGRCS